jgi:tetratricopeptide (TPR) repeat protein
VDCIIDQYEPAPAEGWPSWMERQLEEADFVLVVCTETYLRRSKGQERPGSGKGVRFESVLIVQELYDLAMRNPKFLPVAFSPSDFNYMPRPLRAYTSYWLDTPEGYESLLRHLTSQPRVLKREVGPIPVLPPDQERASYRAASPESARPGEESPSESTSAAGLSPPWPPAAAPLRGLFSKLSRRWRTLGRKPSLFAVTTSFLGLLLATAAYLTFGPIAWYKIGLRDLSRFDHPAAKRHFQWAIATRPGFAQAHSALAEALLRLGESDLAAGEAEQAYEGRAQLSPEDKQLVEARYQWIAQDLPKEASSLFGSLVRNSRRSPRIIDYRLALAETQALAGLSKEGLDTLRDTKSFSGASEDPRIDSLEAKIYSKRNEFANQERAASEAIRKAEARKFAQLEATAHLLRGDALVKKGDLPGGLAEAKRAQLLFNAGEDPRALAQAWNAIAVVRFRQGEFDDADKACQKARGLYEKAGSLREAAYQDQILGRIYTWQGKLRDAQGSLAQALDWFKKVEDEAGLAGTHSAMGIVLTRAGELSRATEELNRALELFREQEDDQQQVVQLSLLAQVLLHKLELTHAKELLGQALAVATGIGEPSEVAEILSGQGELLRLLGSWTGAEENHQKALSQQESLRTKIPVALSQLALARLELEKGDTLESESLLQKAAQEFRSAGMADELRQAASLRATVLLAAGDRSGALAALKAARSGLSESPHVRAEIACAAARFLAAEGELDEARRLLDEALLETKKLGLADMELEVRLTQGEVEREYGNAGRGRELLLGIAKEARQRGAALYARQAEKALSGPPPAKHASGRRGVPIA